MTTEDSRTAVRMNYRVLTDDEKVHVDNIKAAGGYLLEHISASGQGRHQSIAATKAEEAVMWAVKGITE